MSVARVTELKASSTESFDSAVQNGINRACKTLDNVKSAWVKDQEVTVGANGDIEEYRVSLMVTFVLKD